MNNRLKIYMVTCVSEDPHVGNRCWGWFTDFARAEDSVLNNRTDMFECGYYRWAVIEESFEGLLDGCNKTQRWWYEATYPGGPIGRNSQPVIKPIETPTEFKNIVHWWG
jgi:hypothetical protein